MRIASENRTSRLRAGLSQALILLASAVGACQRTQPPDSKPTSAAGGQATTSAPAAAAGANAARPIERRLRRPSGPRLAIIAGKGVGPIRIGATVATIERLMELPCEEKTETVCRYIERGVEFFLKDGVTERIVIHRFDRTAGKNAQGEARVFGIFNGVIPPDVAFGMLPSAVHEVTGPPLRVEQVPTPNPNDTVERHYFDGMVVEFDRHSNGNLIMSGIEITKSNSPSAAPAGAAGNSPTETKPQK